MKNLVTQSLCLVLASFVMEPCMCYILSNSAQAVNNRPIIGILALDTKSTYGKTMIPVTYVKFLEQAGARVVPVKGGQSEDYYMTMVKYTNGMLIPGGAVSLSTSLIARSAKFIFKRVLEINDQGDYYPMWGTCMGFQMLCYLVQGENLLIRTDSDNATWPLNFTSAATKSRMFMNSPVYQILAKEPVAQNQHSYSILMKDFQNSKLAKFFNLLSTNVDRKGVEFVSSVEGKKYPIFGVQWHPEKDNFNWNPNYDINHSKDGVLVSQSMANVFVDQARKNQHQFPSVETEANALIQNYKRVYFDDGSFFENYYIDTAKENF